MLLVNKSEKKLEENRSSSSLAFESRQSLLFELHSRSCISKVEKERLSLTIPASGMKALAQIGDWHNSFNQMPAVILVSPLLNYFLLAGKRPKVRILMQGFFVSR